jgi:hypothetical protein
MLTASVLVALGDAFRSGADQALLYRSCLAVDREADFQTIEARTRAATLVALVVLLLAGGAIVGAWGFAAGWLVETAMSVVGLLIACGMIEPPGGIAAPSAAAATSVVHQAVCRPSVTSIRTLAGLILPASCLGAVAGGAAFFAQTSDWATVERATMLVAIVTLAEAAGAILARRLTADARSQVVLAGLGGSMLAMALLLPSAFTAAIVGLSFLLGIAEPLRATAIQRVSADHVRARAASVASACDKAAGTIALLVAGALPRRR